MAEFLSTVGSSNAIEQLIKNSKDRLYLISPYLQINPLLKSLLQQLDNKVSTIDMRIVSRNDKINGDDLAFLQNLNNAKIFSLDNLHAKCYINQDTAIITSLNLYQYSQQNNIEMGIRIEKKSDLELYNAIYAEVETILSQSKKYDFTIKNNSTVNVKESIQPTENPVHQHGNVSKVESSDKAHNLYPTNKDVQIEKSLRALRTRLSRETGEAAYTIYLDKTILELIAKKPKTKAELLKIYGIGDAKVEKFGDAILSAINN